jgi:O-antigen/teichoic acid export membrane protein
VKTRLLLTNFASMASLRVGLAALTFGLFWILSHRLSTMQLGGFSLLMNCFFMTQPLPLLGLNMPLIRRVASAQSASADLSSSSYFFALPTAVLLGIGLAAAGFWYRTEGLAIPFALLGASMLPTAWIAVAECVLIGKERMLGIAYVNLFEALGRLLGAWAVVHWNFGLTGVFVVFTGMRCAAAIIYLYNSHLSLPRWRQVQDGALLALLREVPTYLAISLVTALCARIDIILLSKLLSLRDAGIYAAAARLSDAALMVPTMAAVVIFPTQSRLFDTNPRDFSRFLEQAVRWCLIGGFAAALIVIAMAPAVIGWIYTPNLAPAGPILRILIIGATVMVVDQLLSTTMMAARAQRTDLKSMTLGLIVLAALLVILTHFFGLAGAAAAPPAAVLVRVTYRLTWAQHELHARFVELAARVLIAAAIAVAVLLWQLTGTEALDVALAFATYASLLWVTRSVRAADWDSLRQMIGQRRASRA